MCINHTHYHNYAHLITHKIAIGTTWNSRPCALHWYRNRVENYRTTLCHESASICRFPVTRSRHRSIVIHQAVAAIEPNFSIITVYDAEKYIRINPYIKFECNIKEQSTLKKKRRCLMQGQKSIIFLWLSINSAW